MKWAAGAAGLLAAGTLVADGGQFKGFAESRPSLDEAIEAYRAAVQSTAGMVGDSGARELFSRQGFDLLNLTWEDTGRFKNSAVGPNISDMTIQVNVANPRAREVERHLMPVIRVPNYSDLTGEMDPRDLTLLVGNQAGAPLKRVSLHDVLVDPGRYLSDQSSWRSRDRTLVAPRDSKVLVSAQACFLPVPRDGIATFNPVLFNYQSSPGNPAVLAILATREGTSMTVVENQRADAASWGWGQILFHNEKGMRASLTGQRLSDYIAKGRPGEPKTGTKVSDDKLNMVMLIQVPLLYDQRSRGTMGGGAGGFAMEDAANAPAKTESKSNVENAVIGHGAVEGPFTEMNDLDVRRDPKFPVRVTVQFYKATSNGVVSSADADQIAKDIGSVYRASTSVGSLVTGGATGRVTEYDGAKVQPPGWWTSFWARYESYSGESRSVAVARLKRALGSGYTEKPVTELYLRDVLRRSP